jgi:isopentenyl diphosphate isomerase/L-lactate dehydrogenase-like FMN-dependent dehydrogenase
MSIIAVGGGQEGVRLLLNQYAEQLHTAMIYTGCASLAEIKPCILRIPAG